MEIQDRDTLGRFARERHVHYEVEPEEVVQGERREPVGFRVRLFATHGESKPELPGCPRCEELLRDLQSFAEGIVADAQAGDRAEIVPASSKLYASTEVPGADEVALTMRVHCDTPEHRRPGAGEDRCLAGIRERLDALGVPRR